MITFTNSLSRLTFGRDADAWFLRMSDARLINLAPIATFGDLADGIAVRGSGAFVETRASVVTRGDGAAAIDVIGARAVVLNESFLETRGGVEAGLAADAVRVTGDGFSVLNRGRIETSGAEAAAIVASGSGGIAVNAGTIFSTSDGGAAMAVLGAGSALGNEGAIWVDAAFGAAMFAAGDRAIVANTGFVSVLADSLSFGLDVTGGGVFVRNAGEVRLGAEQSAAISVDDGVFTAGFGRARETLLNEGVVSTVGDGALGLLARGENVTVQNTGRVSTEGDGAFGLGHGLDLFGFAPSLGARVRNDGTISTVGDGAVGVFVVGDQAFVQNFGHISTAGGVAATGPWGVLAAAGVLAIGEDARIVNAAGASITATGGAPAVALNVFDVEADAFDFGRLEPEHRSAVLVNRGVIRGEVAILGGDGAEQVQNRGRLDGDVDLGGGDDRFLALGGGRLDGVLHLGAGDDRLDLFAGFGRLEVADFTAGKSWIDEIGLWRLGVKAFYDLKAITRQVGEDVVFDFAGTDELVLLDVHVGMLTASDFLFG